jgi:hypothetical protein
MKRRWWLLAALLVVLAASGSACGSAMRSDEPQAYDGGAAEAPAMAPEEPAADVTGGATDLPDADRMIIYTGYLDLVVRDVDGAQDAAVDLVVEAGGHLAGSSSTAYGDGLRRINLTLRVPAGAFNDVMAGLRDLALEIRRESVESQDVTQEYVDLASRLGALEAKAARLETLMEEAEDTEAVLAVYEELSETQIEIEEVKGRMRYLERQSSMSTITVELTPDELSQPVEIAGWRPQGTAKRALEALIETFQFLIDALIWIVIVILPVLVFIGLVIYGIIKVLGLIFGWGKRKERKQQDAGVIPSDVTSVEEPEL